MIIKLVSSLYLYNINLGVQDFYDNPSIEKLAKKLENSTSSKKEQNDNHITDISKIRKELSNYTKKSLKNILLSGVTGFLGIHVLDSLLSTTKCNVYCLVRSKEGKDPKHILLDRLNYYFPKKYNDLFD